MPARTPEEIGHVLTAYIGELLAENDAYKMRKDARIEELEAQGHRIVDGGQVGKGWVTKDWRTGEVISSGVGDDDAEDAEHDRLDPDHRWYHIENVITDVVGQDKVIDAPATIPTSLSEAVREWVDCHERDARQLTAVTAPAQR